MSIATAITAAQGRVASAYTAISNKGGTLPATQNLANMPTAIGSIPVTLPKFGLTIDNYLGNIDGNGRLSSPTTINGITFTGVVDFGQGDPLRGAFAYRNDLSGAISFPDLTDVSYYNCWYPLTDAFRNTNITSVSFPNLVTISKSCQRAFYGCESLTQISFPKLKTISSDYKCASMFEGDISLQSISFPLLETISGTGTCSGMFSGCKKVSSISLPSLKSISDTWGYCASDLFNGCGTDSSVSELVVDLSGLETLYGANSCRNMFYECSKLVTLEFTKLNSVDGVTSGTMFGNCNNLTTLSFPALTTSSFGSTINQFQNMFNNNTASSSGTCTVHFPSNLQSTISGLTGYPTFGGNSNRIVLAFDLTTTS